MKYVIDGMGMEKFLALVEEKLGHALHPACRWKPWRRRPAFDRMAPYRRAQAKSSRG